MHLNAEKFRKIKEVYRLTNDEMGALLGITGAQVSRIINGERTLTKQVARKVEQEFKLTPAKLERILEVWDEFNKEAIAK